MDREDNILSDAEHLYAEDLGGRDVTLTVKSITKEEVRGGGSGKADRKYTFAFAETPKKYIAGVGVRRAICAACGTTDRKLIVGKRLTFYPTTCKAFGQENCPCIRFRCLATDKPTSKQSAPAAEQEGTADAR
jgi:hypothetical protein